MTDPIVFKYESASCELIVWEDEEALASLSEVHSADKGLGHATHLLNRVIGYADENGLTITSAAKPYGNEPGSLNFLQLINFYKKFEFVFLSDDPEYMFMERKPK